MTEGALTLTGAVSEGQNTHDRGSTHIDWSGKRGTDYT